MLLGRPAESIAVLERAAAAARAAPESAQAAEPAPGAAPNAPNDELLKEIEAELVDARVALARWVIGSPRGPSPSAAQARSVIFVVSAVPGGASASLSCLFSACFLADRLSTRREGEKKRAAEAAAAEVAVASRRHALRTGADHLEASQRSQGGGGGGDGAQRGPVERMQSKLFASADCFRSFFKASRPCRAPFLGPSSRAPCARSPLLAKQPDGPCLLPDGPRCAFRRRTKRGRLGAAGRATGPLWQVNAALQPFRRRAAWTGGGVAATAATTMTRARGQTGIRATMMMRERRAVQRAAPFPHVSSSGTHILLLLCPTADGQRRRAAAGGHHARRRAHPHGGAAGGDAEGEAPSFQERPRAWPGCWLQL